MARVYVVNFAGHDHTEAEKWGEVRFVTQGFVNFGSLDRVMYELAKGFEDSEPGDWLLPSGLLLLNVVAAAIWLRKHGELKLLIWDRNAGEGKSRGSYRELKADFQHLDYLLQNLGGGEDERVSSESNTGAGE